PPARAPIRQMTDAIAVVNAGSSSIKLSLFIERGGELELALRSQVEEINTAPRFVAQDPSGNPEAKKTWDAGVALGHAGALDHLLDHLRSRLDGVTLAGIGHRVVH